MATNTPMDTDTSMAINTSMATDTSMALSASIVPNTTVAPNTYPSNHFPSYFGFIDTTIDALVLIEAIVRGNLPLVTRRPQDKDRECLISSGNVFIYEDRTSGIKRWTDGKHWSPSRILGNFLVYRELDHPWEPGSKKRAKKSLASASGGPQSKEEEELRPFVGSLVDSYPFKEDGLMKKTISLHYAGVCYHIVSYYSVIDVRLGRIVDVCRDVSINYNIPRVELFMGQSFRVPIEQKTVYADKWAVPLPYTKNHVPFMPRHANPYFYHTVKPVYPPRTQYLGQFFAQQPVRYPRQIEYFHPNERQRTMSAPSIPQNPSCGPSDYSSDPYGSQPGDNSGAFHDGPSDDHHNYVNDVSDPGPSGYGHEVGDAGPSGYGNQVSDPGPSGYGNQVSDPGPSSYGNQVSDPGLSGYNDLGLSGYGSQASDPGPSGYNEVSNQSPSGYGDEQPSSFGSPESDDSTDSDFAFIEVARAMTSQPPTDNTQNYYDPSVLIEMANRGYTHPASTIEQPRTVAPACTMYNYTETSIGQGSSSRARNFLTTPLGTRTDLTDHSDVRSSPSSSIHQPIVYTDEHYTSAGGPSSALTQPAGKRSDFSSSPFGEMLSSRSDGEVSWYLP